MIEHQLCKERTCDSLQNEVPAALPVHCLAQLLNLSLIANHTKRLSPEQYSHICVELVKKYSNLKHDSGTEYVSIYDYAWDGCIAFM